MTIKQHDAELLNTSDQYYHMLFRKAKTVNKSCSCLLHSFICGLLGH